MCAILGFFSSKPGSSSNRIAPPLQCMGFPWDLLTPDPNPMRPSAPRSRSVRGAQVGLANWRQEALPSGELTYPHFGKRTINENHLQNCYLWKSLYSFFFEPTNMGHSITNPKQHTLFRENTQKCSYDCGGTPPLWIPWKSTQNDPLQMGFCFPL